MRPATRKRGIPSPGIVGATVLAAGIMGGSAMAGGNWTTGILAGAGSMQQPSSQYYLLAYVANAFVEYKPVKAGISLTAIGRPKFSNGGYEDQDYGGFVELRKSVASRGPFSLAASFGGGQMRGYIKSTAEDGTRSDYRMDGACVTVDLRYNPSIDGKFTAQLSHTMFAGFGAELETRARVAWPWSFVMLGLGYGA